MKIRMKKNGAINHLKKKRFEKLTTKAQRKIRKMKKDKRINMNRSVIPEGSLQLSVELMQASAKILIPTGSRFGTG